MESGQVARHHLPDDQNASLILVMGVTGAGKSYFINKLAGEEIVKVGSSLSSCELRMFPLNGRTPPADTICTCGGR